MEPPWGVANAAPVPASDITGVLLPVNSGHSYSEADASRGGLALVPTAG